MRFLSLLLLLVLSAAAVSAQKIEDRILQKSKQRANRKLDRTIDKGLDKVEKGIDESVSGDGQDKQKPPAKTAEKKTDAKEEAEKSANASPATQGKTFDAYTKFDFVPGSAILFIDDFSVDNLGDFPAKWNTNGSGEVVTATDDSGKWFEMKLSSLYVPTLPKKLPEDYTLEFDLMTSGLSNKTSSTAFVQILLDDNVLFKPGKNRAQVSIPLAQYGVVGVRVANHVNGAEVISNTLKPDLRKKISNGVHISVAVTGKRFRLWADEEKIIDMPTLIPPGSIQAVKFELKGFSNDYESARVFMGNVKLAAGGTDLRSKLISEGKLSTTAITFDVNSDKLRPESMGMIKEISAVLAANPEVRVKIIGHTDTDGDDAHNLTLSKSRAAAVKNTLVNSFKIPSNRIETDGKGESQPAAPNDSAEGKAANRRVEFIKL